jgi:hypothetical protein
MTNMQLEYRVSFDYETRKGFITLYQDGVQIGEAQPIKHLHLSQSRSIDYVKNEDGIVTDMKKSGPTMTTFTMTGDDE